MTVYQHEPWRKVSYLHRTVKDFLKTASVRAKFECSTSRVAEFNPDLSLILSFITALKRFQQSLNREMGFIPGKPRVCEMTTTFLKLAARLDAQNHDSSKEVTEFLEEFYNWWSDPAFIPRCIPPTRAEWREASLLIATWLGTFNYVDAYLRGGGISSRSVFLSTTLHPAALGLGDVSHSYHIRKVFSPDRHQLEPKLV